MAPEATNETVQGRTIRLRDGRHLGYVEYGDLKGSPVFYCHGFPSSRLQARLLEQAARSAGVRLISADRPGHGLSSHQPGRRVIDWAGDVAQLADSLGLETFSVFGVSGGGPYALACAARLPERVSGAAIASSSAPPEARSRGMNFFFRYMNWLGKKFPFLQVVPLSMFQRELLRDPNEALKRFIAFLPPTDQALFDDATTRQLYIDDLKEAFRQGLDGPVSDANAQDGDWGFRIQDIRVPVQIWQGEQDRNVPPVMAQYQHSRIPSSRAVFLKEEAHHSLVLRRGTDILRELAYS